MRIEWTGALATGVSEIDEQHKELIARINALLEACEDNRGRDEVGRVIDFLEEYVVTHFSTEENRMFAAGYPEYRQHKAEHAIFIERVADVKHKFRSDSAAPDVLHLATRTLMEWLDVHIRRTDRRLGDYIRHYGATMGL
jgi:hemerythrin